MDLMVVEPQEMVISEYSFEVEIRFNSRRTSSSVVDILTGTELETLGKCVRLWVRI